MGIVAIAFAVATALVILLSLKRADALLASVSLAAVCAVTDGLQLMGDNFQTIATVNVFMDWCAAVGFILAWRFMWPPRWWLFPLACLSLFQVFAHWASDLTHPGAAYRMVLTCNILFALQLLTVVIGPRSAQIATYARGLVTGADGPRDSRVRPRGVVASLDKAICALGAAALREKRR